MTAEGPAGFAVTRWGHVGGHRREGGSRRDRLHGAVSGSGPTRGTQHRVTAQGDATPTATQGVPPAGRAGGGCTQTRALPLPFFFRTEACKQKGECESQAAAPTGAWVPGPPDPARPDPPRMRPRRGRAGVCGLPGTWTPGPTFRRVPLVTPFLRPQRPAWTAGSARHVGAGRARTGRGGRGLGGRGGVRLSEPTPREPPFAGGLLAGPLRGGGPCRRPFGERVAQAPHFRRHAVIPLSPRGPRQGPGTVGFSGLVSQT